MNDNRFFSKIGFSYFTYAIMIIVAQLIVMQFLAIIPIKIYLTQDLLTIISSFCTYVIPLPIFLYMMSKIPSIQLNKHKLKITEIIMAIGIAITLMWIGNIIGLTITSLISIAKGSAVANPAVHLISTSDIWINLLIMTLIAPIFEEFFFRKFLIDRTIKYGELISVLLSAFLFGIFHGNLNQFFYAFLIGGFFAIIYIKTGNIWYTVGLHMTINFMGSVVSMLVAPYLTHILTNQAQTMDILVAGCYILLILILIIIGILAIIFKGKNLKLSKNLLEKPWQTIFLNAGMIVFIIFEVYQMVKSFIL